jgi:ketosteroid isomerase-like protein
VEDPNVEVVRALWAAVEQGGIEAALNVAEPDVEWIPHFGAGQAFRTDELLEFLRAFQGDRHVVIGMPYWIRSKGDFVLASGTFRQRSPGGDLHDFQIQWLYEFSNGKLVRARSFARLAEALEAFEAAGEGTQPATAESGN